MRRLTAWAAGIAAGAAAVGFLRRRRTPSAAPEASEPPDTRADELRAKLEEARLAGDDREAYEAGETTVDAAPDPEKRRRAVHERARGAIDEMRGDELG